LATHLALLRGLRDPQAFVADLFAFTTNPGPPNGPANPTSLSLYYTNADVPITYQGYVYVANSILVDGLKFKCSIGLEVDQQQITIAARPTDTFGGVPFLQAMRSGLLDGAEITRTRVFLNSWSPSDCANPIGGTILFKGRVGTVDSIGRTSAQVTVNSDLVLLDIQMPRNLYAPNCQHRLFDAGCGLIKSAYGMSGTVGSGSTAYAINWSGSSSAYAQGTITFSTGANAGVTANVKSATSNTLSLSYALPNAPSTGDAFTAYQGCDHTQSTCQNKFGNLANFRGFPYVPPPTFAI
jgi:uncharacterized phage protein (TIGR02218 family)